MSEMQKAAQAVIDALDADRQGLYDQLKTPSLEQAAQYSRLVEAARQALEALEIHYLADAFSPQGKAITALRRALEQQPADEPVAEVVEDDFSRQVKGIGKWHSLPNGTKLYTRPQPAAQCEWQPEDDVHMPGTWRSDCGVLWTFTDGSPVENDMKYCCGCGAKLREKNGGSAE